MLFYVIISCLALLGIVLVFVLRAQGSSVSWTDVTSFMRSNFIEIKKNIVLKKASKQQVVKKDSPGFFEKEDNEVRSEIWQEKSTADLCAMIESSLEERNPDKALEYLEFLLDKYHDREIQEYIYSLAVAVYEGMKNWKAALDYCHKLLEISPGDIACMQKIADLQFMLRDYKQTEETLNRILKLKADQIDALDLLAKVYAKTVRMREAEEIKRQVVDLRMKKT